MARGAAPDTVRIGDNDGDRTCNLYACNSSCQHADAAGTPTGYDTGGRSGLWRCDHTAPPRSGLIQMPQFAGRWETKEREDGTRGSTVKRAVSEDWAEAMT